jgi:hypothetical protein
LQKKRQLKNAAFTRDFDKLEEEGFFDELAKNLKLRREAALRADAAKKTPLKINGKKTSGRAVTRSVSLSAAGK